MRGAAGLIGFVVMACVIPAPAVETRADSGAGRAAAPKRPDDRADRSIPGLTIDSGEPVTRPVALDPAAGAGRISAASSGIPDINAFIQNDGSRVFENLGNLTNLGRTTMSRLGEHVTGPGAELPGQVAIESVIFGRVDVVARDPEFARVFWRPVRAPSMLTEPVFTIADVAGTGVRGLVPR
jgi:hypothetical protein